MATITSNKRNAKSSKNTVHIQESESITPSFGRGLNGENWSVTVWGDERVFTLKFTKEEVIYIIKHWNKGVDASNAKC